MDPLQYHKEAMDMMTAAIDRAAAPARKPRKQWNVEATFTVRMKLRTVKERYGDDADGNRGEDRTYIEIEQMETEGDNDAIRKLCEGALDIADEIELREIAKDAGL